MSFGNIICIDDDRGILVSLRDQLTPVISHEYQIELAESGAEAIEMIEECLEDAEAVPLIICDQNLPDIQGSELLKNIHQILPNTRKILLTGETNPEALIKAINLANLYRYIPKPWDKTDLSLTVKEALRSYRQDEQLIEQNKQLRAINQQLQAEIEERELAQSQLVHDALHDSLTGLPNRTLLMERIHQALKRRRSDSEAFIAILFIDLDRFKSINDSLGHAVGDELLIQITHRLQSCVREGDTVSRLGGDEFIILLDGLCCTHDAVIIAERILEKFDLAFNLGAHTVFSGASIGIATTDNKHAEGSALIRDADIAMYQAKNSGKARYVIFNRMMYTQRVESLELEQDLRLAVEREELLLYYQPIVELKTCKLKGLEALVRWHHPVRGMISPNHFIPLAEDTGLIIPIGKQILDIACQQLRQLKREFPKAQGVKVSINLACKQLKDDDFVAAIDQALLQANLPGDSLRLEITETTLMDSSEAMVEILRQLRQRGIEISLDDFGTGYSSLSYLPRLPLDTLKIDQSFVRAMNHETEDLEIVRTIIALAHNLKMNVIAEGIELASHVQKLTTLGCDLGQGYFFSKPMHFDDLRTLFADVREVPSLRSFTVV